ncbi:MAG: glutaredoxin family protein [Bacteroidota bacterium]
MSRLSVFALAIVLLAGCRIEGRTGTASEAGPSASAPAASAAAPTGDAGVILYVTEWCPYCQAAQDYLDQRGTEYRLVDIEAGESEYVEYARQGGTGSIPLIIVGDERMQGYREDVLEAMLGRSGI